MLIYVIPYVLALGLLFAIEMGFLKKKKKKDQIMEERTMLTEIVSLSSPYFCITNQCFQNWEYALLMVAVKG